MKNRKRHSQKAFKEALCTLLQQKTLDKVFVKEILELADYSSMAFYASYHDKYDLAKKIIEEEAEFHIDMLYDLISLEVGQNDFNQLELFEKSSNSFFSHVQQNKQIYKCIFNNLLMADAVGYFTHYSLELINDSFVFENQKDTIVNAYYNFFVEQSISMLLHAAKYWMKHQFNISSKEFAKLYARYKSGWKTSILSLNYENKIEIRIEEY